MSDSRSGHDQDQLLWLEAVEDEETAQGLPARKMIAAVLVVLLAIGIVGATLFWLGKRDASNSGPPELIRAENGPYKVKPDNPGGLDVAGESETAFATSAGEDHDAELDLAAVPEAPIERPSPKAAQPVEQAAPAPAKSQTAAVPAPTASPGSMIQLGFYANGAQANAAWEALAGRFSALGGMTKIVVPYEKGFRLRAGAASTDEAKRTCQLLKVAGENCFVVR